MKFQVTFTAPEGKQVTETVESQGKHPPEGAYASLGRPWGARRGELFVMRLCQGGTCLISLHHLNGKRARASARYAGKTFRGGRWHNS